MNRSSQNRQERHTPDRVACQSSSPLERNGLEAGKHLLRFGKACEWHVFARSSELGPEFQNGWVAVCLLDGLCREPLEDFNERAVLAAHDICGPVGDQSFRGENAKMLGDGRIELEIFAWLRL